MGTKAYRLAGSPAFRDPIAGAIWRARVEAAPLPADVVEEQISVTRARGIAQELYAALEKAGHVLDGWKVVSFAKPKDSDSNPGGTDTATGESWGRGRPYTAPFYKAFCLASPGAIDLADFIAPVLECELGIIVEEGRAVGAMACVEIDDVRYPAAKLDFPRLIADFCAAGVMLYGATTVPVESLGAQLRATVAHDGEIVQVSDFVVAECVPRATYPPPERPVPGRARVASGAVVNSPQLTPGAWRVDFGPLLGAIDILVERHP